MPPPHHCLRFLLLPLALPATAAAAAAAAGQAVANDDDATCPQVSDLGEASLDPAMSRSQATEAVRNATRNHWPAAKLPKFVSDVVPFQPLSPAEMALVAQLELEKYRDGEYTVHRVPCALLAPEMMDGGVTHAYVHCITCYVYIIKHSHTRPDQLSLTTLCLFLVVAVAVVVQS